jgi:hypothetical protein
VGPTFDPTVAIFRLAVKLSVGAVIQLPDSTGQVFSVGPYLTACGDWSTRFAAFVGPEIWPIADACDGARLAAQLACPVALQAWLNEHAA